jgi:hypothetical protein
LWVWEWNIEDVRRDTVEKGEEVGTYFLGLSLESKSGEVNFLRGEQDNPSWTGDLKMLK